MISPFRVVRIGSKSSVCVIAAMVLGAFAAIAKTIQALIALLPRPHGFCSLGVAGRKPGGGPGRVVYMSLYHIHARVFAWFSPCAARASMLRRFRSQALPHQQGLALWASYGIAEGSPPLVVYFASILSPRREGDLSRLQYGVVASVVGDYLLAIVQISISMSLQRKSTHDGEVNGWPMQRSLRPVL